MPDDHQRWALILGASSGFGEATSIALAAAGYDICGVHLDRRQGMQRVESIRQRIAGHGREALFFNVNAADDEQRGRVISALGERLDAARSGSVGGGSAGGGSAAGGSAGAGGADRGSRPYVRVLFHSLAFGTLKPFLAREPENAINRKNMEMTLDVMANSLVYWAQDAWRAGLLGEGSKIYAMTSEGSSRVVASYGAVSAAKSALESHCRQLAMEFARLGSGVTVNAIRAGVTRTPALMQIPEAQELIDHATRRNPMGRMTEVDDVARAVVALSADGTHWLTGNVIGIDGGELITG